MKTPIDKELMICAQKAEPESEVPSTEFMVRSIHDKISLWTSEYLKTTHLLKKKQKLPKNLNLIQENTTVRTEQHQKPRTEGGRSRRKDQGRQMVHRGGTCHGERIDNRRLFARAPSPFSNRTQYGSASVCLSTCLSVCTVCIFCNRIGRGVRRSH